MKPHVAVALALSGPLLAPARLPAAVTDPPKVRFSRDVRPILADKCFACHGPDQARRKAGLRLDARDDATADRGGYAAIVPGDPGASELIARINATDPDEVMPPPGHPKALTPGEKRLLERWVREGARYDAHWAYVRPDRPPLPRVRDASWPRNAIDHFVLAALEAQGLSPSPEADRATLIRRLSLDLIGLPPTPAEVDAFLADRDPHAFEKLADRLLASPEFGERWARPWLDQARYADSHGFQRDDLREIWPYRDWVIRALNRDLPFDRFTIEQLAGDLLPGATPEQVVATGFHRCAPTNVEAGTDPEESRINQVIDRVNTTGAVWLGATLECARCHDHKFDPIRQEEYYRLLAFFNSTESEVGRANPKVPSSIRFVGPSLILQEDATRAERERLRAEVARLERAIDALVAEAAEGQSDWEARVGQVLHLDGSGPGDREGPARTVPSRVAALLRLPADRRNARQRRELRDYYLARSPEATRLEREKAHAEKRLEAVKPPSTLVMRELARPRRTAVFNRGEPTDPGAPVSPGVPAVLPPLPDGPPDRLTLARWLVSRDNPLTARVAVNRWWAEVFGRGLVATVEDFGLQGEPPSHPELLDWLAVELMDSGWSMKALLRRVVTSATYRQASRATAEARARDPQNRWLSRGPRLRMDAEMIRDHALAAAGLLHLEKGGPPIRPPQPEGLWAKVGGQRYAYEVSPGSERHRRGVYVVLKRGSPYPSFAAFDATARMGCVLARSRSNTPLQALTLLNDPVYVEAAMALARRALAEAPRTGVDDRIAYAFRLCLARPPVAEEAAVLRRLYDRQLAASREDRDGARALVGTLPSPPGVSAEEMAAWYGVASALMNLDEAITKP